jgi:hypothetical protein
MLSTPTFIKPITIPRYLTIVYCLLRGAAPIGLMYEKRGMEEEEDIPLVKPCQQQARQAACGDMGTAGGCGIFCFFQCHLPRHCHCRQHRRRCARHPMAALALA